MEGVSARYLVDTSTFARTRLPAFRLILGPLIRAGEVATCGVITLEGLYSTRGIADLRATREELAHALTSIPMFQADFDRIAAFTEQPVRWVAPRGSL
jgi:predicted nucleic acid-binding protein